MKAQDHPTGQWSRPLRLLHLLLAITVTAQLFGSMYLAKGPTKIKEDYGNDA